MKTFMAQRVGGPVVLRGMLKTGVLSDGTPITYASGVHEEHFHGLPFVEHSGYIWGFKSDLLHFPNQHYSIIVLTNTDDCDAPTLAFSIAEIYLKSFFRKPPPKPHVVAVSPALIDKYVGTYEIAAGTTLRAPGKQLVFRLEDFIGEKAQLAASSDSDFFALRSNFRVSFVPAQDGGASTRAVIHEPSGDNFVARRIEPQPRKPAVLKGSLKDQPIYTGPFHSEELGVLYSVELRDGQLWMRYPAGEFELRPQSLDTFLARRDPDQNISFTRNNNGMIDGFLPPNKVTVSRIFDF